MRKDIRAKDEKADNLQKDIKEFKTLVREVTHELKLKDEKFE